ncbi:PAS domain-containing protein [Pseudoxanthomonas sp. NC8]|nr:PAS domain-containing protein [Pseudoxanthomonas sp. NC8]
MQDLDPLASATLAALPLPVLLLGAGGSVLEVNPACAERFAVASEHWRGRPLDVHLDIYPALAALLAAAIADGAVDCETSLRCPGLGEHVGLTMQLSLRRLPAVAGATPRLLLSLQDLTHERHLERILTDAQARAGVGSWHADIPTGRLQLTPEAYRVCGLGEDEVVDYERLLRCVHPQDRACVRDCWHQGAAGAPFAVEHRVRAAGDVRWVETRGVLETDEHGRALRMVGSVLDITRHKHAEESIRQLIHDDTLTRLPNRNAARIRLRGCCVATASRPRSACWWWTWTGSRNSTTKPA